MFKNSVGVVMQVLSDIQQDPNPGRAIKEMVQKNSNVLRAAQKTLAHIQATLTELQRAYDLKRVELQRYVKIRQTKLEEEFDSKKRKLSDLLKRQEKIIRRSRRYVNTLVRVEGMLEKDTSSEGTSSEDTPPVTVTRNEDISSQDALPETVTRNAIEITSSKDTPSTIPDLVPVLNSRVTQQQPLLPLQTPNPRTYHWTMYKKTKPLSESELRTYFTKAKPADEVLVVLPNHMDSRWRDKAPYTGFRDDFQYCGPYCTKSSRVPKVNRDMGKRRKNTHRYFWIPPGLPMRFVAVWPGMKVSKADSWVSLRKGNTVTLYPESLPCKNGPCRFVDAKGKTCPERAPGATSLIPVQDEKGNILGPFQQKDAAAQRLLELGIPITRCVLGGQPHPHKSATVCAVKATPEVLAFLKSVGIEMPYRVYDQEGKLFVVAGVTEDQLWRLQNGDGLRCPIHYRVRMNVPSKTKMVDTAARSQTQTGSTTRNGFPQSI